MLHAKLHVHSSLGESSSLFFVYRTVVTALLRTSLTATDNPVGQGHPETSRASQEAQQESERQYDWFMVSEFASTYIGVQHVPRRTAQSGDSS
jgi:hypothetical protein